MDNFEFVPTDEQEGDGKDASQDYLDTGISLNLIIPNSFVQLLNFFRVYEFTSCS